MLGRKRNWYFNGWESRKEMSSSGRVRTVWTYNDDYYAFDLSPKAFRLLKICFIAVPALIVLLWIFFSLVKSIGRDTVLYVGAFWYVSVIPMIYMVMGAAGAFKLQPEMTYRDIYACYRRIKVASWILPVLFLLSVIGNVVFLIIYKEYFSIQTELLWMIGAFVLFLLSLFLFIVQVKVKNKIKVVKKKTEEE